MEVEMLLTSLGYVRKKVSCCTVPYTVCTPDTPTVLVGHGTTWTPCHTIIVTTFNFLSLFLECVCVHVKVESCHWVSSWIS